MEVCYGCLNPFKREVEAQSDADTEPLVIEPKASSTERFGRAPLEITRDQTNQSIMVSDPARNSVLSGGMAGMARLHVKLPQGYHYDVYLEKPEGASIQLGWVPVAE